jgi:uncharacterized protein (TIGR02996 family)
MDTEGTLLSAIAANPADLLPWRALADWLEEDGQPDRAELARLTLRLRLERGHADRLRWQEGMQRLLADGVRPCVPEITNSIGMRLVLIPAGAFTMGAPEAESGFWRSERLREVEITRPFWMGVFVVTQQEYRRVRKNNPAAFRQGGARAGEVVGHDTDRFPVEQVSWFQATGFCLRLTERPQEQAAGRSYRLPTEAEWEYACRAGTASPFHFGPTLSTAQANFDGSRPYDGAPQEPALDRPCVVGSYPPNAFGLYDLRGNVWEWCSDWRDSDESVPPAPLRDPTGPDVPGGGTRCSRGGAWSFSANHCRAAYRGHDAPNGRYDNTGLRVVCDIATPRR